MLTPSHSSEGWNPVKKDFSWILLDSSLRWNDSSEYEFVSVKPIFHVIVNAKKRSTHVYDFHRQADF